MRDAVEDLRIGNADSFLYTVEEKMLADWWIQVNHRLRALLTRKAGDGQGLVEYTLILAFVALVVFIVLKLVAPNLSATLNNVSNTL